MKARLKESSDYCPIATMNDLLKIVEESDKNTDFRLRRAGSGNIVRKKVHLQFLPIHFLT